MQTGGGSDLRSMLKLPRFYGEYVAVYRDESEVIVYGSGSDWIVQYANTTNPDDNWRKWFADRKKAEAFAGELCSKPYRGPLSRKKK